MLCWYCYWGWSVPVMAIYHKYLDLAGHSALHSGPAHCIWEDENFDRDCVQHSLDIWDSAEQSEWATAEEHAFARQSLEALLALDDAVLAPEPIDYDGEHPEQYPPTVPVTKDF